MVQTMDEQAVTGNSSSSNSDDRIASLTEGTSSSSSSHYNGLITTTTDEEGEGKVMSHSGATSRSDSTAPGGGGVVVSGDDESHPQNGATVEANVASSTTICSNGCKDNNDKSTTARTTTSPPPKHDTPQTSPSSSASTYEKQEPVKDRQSSSSSKKKKNVTMQSRRIVASAAAGTTMTPKEQQEQQHHQKLSRTRSPYWSSSEESSLHRPDTASNSSSSEDTEELRQQQYAQNLASATARATVRHTVPPSSSLQSSSSPTWSKLILKREQQKHDDDDDDEHDHDSTVVDYEQADRFGDLPDIFFPPKPRETASIRMSSADIEICQRLDMEYERALEEREVGYNARYQSVRQSAAFIMIFMVAYLAGGTAFFTQEAGWAVHDALFFSVYTMTTVGYGLNDNIPDHDRFMIFIIFYIFTGIATLTIMVAQVYQCIALEATRAQHARDKAVKTLKKSGASASSVGSGGRGPGGKRNRRGTSHIEPSSSLPMATTSTDSMMATMMMMPELDTTSHHEKCWDTCVRLYERSMIYFRDSEIGRGLSVVFPFAGLIFIGAAVVGPMEGWTVIESIYFAVVSLTTVGYGLYVPKNQIAIYFCIVWLPFSVGFMSLYLSNVASFYIRLSDRNIQRLEQQMRRRIKAAKEEAQGATTTVGGGGNGSGSSSRRHVHPRGMRNTAAYTNANHGTDDDTSKDGSMTKQHKQQQQQPNGFEMLVAADDEEAPPLHGISSAAELGERRRNQILTHSNYARTSEEDERSTGRTMQTMRDIIQTVKHNLAVAENNLETDEEGPWEDEPMDEYLRSQESEFMTIRSSQEIFSPTRRSKNVQHKPTFALRVLVQERFAEIIATDIAGFQSHIDIKENTLSVTIDTLKDTADKWLIPRRARKAFRAVAFEALYFVGEHGLITRGADALFDLSPFEFHGLFSPLLAAMGDAELMEGWLATTVVLADVDLKHDGYSGAGGSVGSGAGPSGSGSGSAGVMHSPTRRTTTTTTTTTGVRNVALSAANSSTITATTGTNGTSHHHHLSQSNPTQESSSNNATTVTTGKKAPPGTSRSVEPRMRTNPSVSKDTTNLVPHYPSPTDTKRSTTSMMIEDAVVA